MTDSEKIYAIAEFVVNGVYNSTSGRVYLLDNKIKLYEIFDLTAGMYSPDSLFEMVNSFMHKYHEQFELFGISSCNNYSSIGLKYLGKEVH